MPWQGKAGVIKETDMQQVTTTAQKGQARSWVRRSFRVTCLGGKTRTPFRSAQDGKCLPSQQRTPTGHTHTEQHRPHAARAVNARMSGVYGFPSSPPQSVARTGCARAGEQYLPTHIKKQAGHSTATHLDQLLVQAVQRAGAQVVARRRPLALAGGVWGWFKRKRNPSVRVASRGTQSSPAAGRSPLPVASAGGSRGNAALQ